MKRLHFLYALLLPLRIVTFGAWPEFTAADGIFVLLLFASFCLWKKSYKIDSPKLIDWVILAYLACTIITQLYTPIIQKYSGILRQAYLLITFLFFRFAKFNHDEKQTCLCGFILGSLISCLAGIMGVLISIVSNIKTPWAYTLENYPYMVGFSRALGLSYTPNLLFNFLALSLIVLSWPKFADKTPCIYQKKVARWIFWVGCLLTLSRSILALIAALWVGRMYMMNSRWKHFKAISILFVFGFIAFISANFVVVSSNANVRADIVTADKIISTFSIPFVGNLRVSPTVYLSLKLAATKMFLHSKIMGIGDGNFRRYLEMKRSELRYPVKFNSYNPHCTYTAITGENGIVGIICFSLFSILMAHKAWNQCKLNPSYYITLVFLVYLTIEGINVDQLHFRHYYMLLGLFLRNV